MIATRTPVLLARNDMATSAHFHVDSGPTVGFGHVARCEAIAESLRARGGEVSLESPLRLPRWAHAAYPVLSAARVAPLCRSKRPDHVHIFDSYLDSAPEQLASLSCYGRRAWIQDVDHVAVAADLIINPNIGSFLKSAPGTGNHGPRLLFGGKYTPIRRRIRDAASAMRTREDRLPPPRIVVSAGGAKNSRALSYMVESLMSMDVEVVVVSSEPVGGKSLKESGSLSIMPPTPNLHWALRARDVLLVTSGTTVWDMFLLGIPVAVTTTSAIQRPIVERLAKVGLATYLGDVFCWTAPGIEGLNHLCQDDQVYSERKERARQSLDGRGSDRIVDELDILVACAYPRH